MDSFVSQLQTLSDAEYIAKRLEAAENYIKNCPCDPDITPDQREAYHTWNKLKEQRPQTVFAGVRLD